MENQFNNSENNPCSSSGQPKGTMNPDATIFAPTNNPKNNVKGAIQSRVYYNTSTQPRQQRNPPLGPSKARTDLQSGSRQWANASNVPGDQGVHNDTRIMDGSSFAAISKMLQLPGSNTLASKIPDETPAGLAQFVDNDPTAESDLLSILNSITESSVDLAHALSTEPTNVDEDINAIMGSQEEADPFEVCLNSLPVGGRDQQYLYDENDAEPSGGKEENIKIAPIVNSQNKENSKKMVELLIPDPNTTMLRSNVSSQSLFHSGNASSDDENKEEPLSDNDDNATTNDQEHTGDQSGGNHTDNNPPLVSLDDFEQLNQTPVPKLPDLTQRKLSLTNELIGEVTNDSNKYLLEMLTSITVTLRKLYDQQSIMSDQYDTLMQAFKASVEFTNATVNKLSMKITQLTAQCNELATAHKAAQADRIAELASSSNDAIKLHESISKLDAMYSKCEGWTAVNAESFRSTVSTMRNDMATLQTKMTQELADIVPNIKDNMIIALQEYDELRHTAGTIPEGTMPQTLPNVVTKVPIIKPKPSVPTNTSVGSSKIYQEPSQLTSLTQVVNLISDGEAAYLNLEIVEQVKKTDCRFEQFLTEDMRKLIVLANSSKFPSVATALGFTPQSKSKKEIIKEFLIFMAEKYVKAITPTPIFKGKGGYTRNPHIK